MIYRLKKDLGSLKKGSDVRFVKGVFVNGDASFDPLDVLSDTDTFEEVTETVNASFANFETAQ